MQRMIISLAAMAGLALTACGSPEKADPQRTEFVTKCMGLKTYAQYKNKTRRGVTLESYCGCLYDKTMRDLTESERRVAAFYLMSQAGGEEQSRDDIKDVDMSTLGSDMIRASVAIGEAVQKCPKP